MTPATKKRIRRAGGYAASLAIVAWLLFVVLPEVGDVEGAGTLLRERIGADDIVLLAGVLAVHFVAHGLTLTAAVEALGVPTATAVRLVSGGVGRFLPFGWAIGSGVLFAMLRARGVTRGAAGRALAVTGTWNLVTKICLPLVGVVAVAGWGFEAEVRGWATAGLTIVALGLVGVALWLLLHDEVGRWLGRVLERPAAALARWRGHAGAADLAGTLVRFQVETKDALRQRPVAAAGWYFAYHISHAAVLWVALLAVAGPGGPGVTWAEAFAAFAVGYLLTGIPFTPGGIGAFDVVVIGGLTIGGADPDVATAAVALFRIATYAIYAPAAAAAWPTWRRLRRSGRYDLDDARGGAARRADPEGPRDDVAEAEGFEPSRGD